MFDVGFSELVLLFVIGLLILGPERLPRVAAKIGRWVGRARRTATQLRMQFEREMTMQDIMRQQHKPPHTNEANKAEANKAETKEDTPSSDENAAAAASTEPADAGQVVGEQAAAPETREPDSGASAARGDEVR